MKRWIAWVVTLAQFGFVLSAQADTLALGRKTADLFLRGDLETVWAASTPEMQRAFGSIRKMAALRDDLLASFGTEEKILSEREKRQPDLEIYTRLSRWSGNPAPLELVIAFDKTDRIAGFLVRPQPVAAQSPHLNYQTKAKLRLPVSGTW